MSKYPKEKTPADARAALEKAVWRNTHPDFRGTHHLRRDGRATAIAKSVLHLIPGKGTCIVLLRDLSAEELLRKLPSAARADFELLWGDLLRILREGGAPG